MEDDFKPTPAAALRQSPSDAKTQAETIELAQGYLANAELSLSITEEFAYVDAEAWPKFDQRGGSQV